MKLAVISILILGAVDLSRFFCRRLLAIFTRRRLCRL